MTKDAIVATFVGAGSVGLGAGAAIAYGDLRWPRWMRIPLYVAFVIVVSVLLDDLPKQGFAIVGVAVAVMLVVLASKSSHDDDRESLSSAASYLPGD